MRKTELIFIGLSVLVSLGILIGCGGGGGGGGSTTTFYGVVTEVESGNDNPVESATVELWRDGLFMVATDQTDVNGVFTLVGSNVQGEDVFFKVYKDPGNVPLNTELHTVPPVSVLASTIDLPLISDSIALQLGSAVWGVSEPSWNSTVQAYGYLVAEVNASGWGDTTPDGVTVLETGAGGAILNSSNIYYNDGNDVFATTNMTSQSDSSTQFPMVAARTTLADLMYTFESLNHPDGASTVGAKQAWLIAGEITIVNLEP